MTDNVNMNARPDRAKPSFVATKQIEVSECWFKTTPITFVKLPFLVFKLIPNPAGGDGVHRGSIEVQQEILRTTLDMFLLTDLQSSKSPTRAAPRFLLPILIYRIIPNEVKATFLTFCLSGLS